MGLTGHTLYKVINIARTKEFVKHFPRRSIRCMKNGF